MPLYMIMFPFLVIAAYYAVAQIPNLENSDWSLLAIAVDTLPNWMIGVIAGGGALTAILVMAMSALCVGGLFSKNIMGVIKPDLEEKKMTSPGSCCNSSIPDRRCHRSAVLPGTDG